jgi:serine/threonine-protein kinase
MSEPSLSNEPLFDPSLSSVDQLRRRFVADWEDSLTKGCSPPELHKYLEGLPEPCRSQAQRELEALDQSYRRRLASNETVAASRLPGETIPDPLRAEQGTVDYALPLPIPDPETLSAETGSSAAEAFSFDERAAEVVGDTNLPAESAASTVDYRRAETAGKSAPRTAEDDDTEKGGGSRSPQEGCTPPRVAGYEILSVLGRGAMGIVFKARQPGLKRLVALKMILAGAEASERDVSRFRVEAEAVAHLQHPNIVQIYEVGEDAGRPFFSLEYIEGVSLAKRINGVPLPPRQAAELLLQLAHGIDYAHQKGIIHRDLKPANVLLTPDGVAKITDFGLAKKLEDESGQTVSGTVLGTPSYMSPEQAEGEIQKVGPLADVYSLGAVLYEMLTGRPPFRGTKMLDTLQMVRTREPVAPCELQPKVPGDLETICLKCLQKDPARRYTSAAALAEDLRRYLAGEPILARPVGAFERFWRWCRRNPRVAALSTAVVLLLIVWAATSSSLAYVAVQNEKRAERNEQKAKEAAEESEKNAETARQNALVSGTRQQNAFLKMVALGGEFQKRLYSRRLSEKLGPEARTLRDQLMAVLRARMLDLAREVEEKNVSSSSSAAVYQQLGDLLLGLGQGKEALRQFEEGYRIVKKSADEQPDSNRARYNLSVMLMRLGDAALEVNGDAKTARDYHQKGWDLQHEVYLHPHGTDYPAVNGPVHLSHHAVRLGRALLSLGRPAEAMKHFQEGLKLRKEWAAAVSHSAESRSYLVEANMWLGTTAWHRGDSKATTQYFRDGLELGETLAKEHPGDFSFKEDLAVVYGAQGDALTRLGREEEARASYQRSRENLEILLARNPDDPEQQPNLALLHERLGGMAQRRGERMEAEKHYREALKLREDLAVLHPDHRIWQAAYVLTLARCGKHAQAARRADDLRRQAGQSPESLLQLARCHAVCASAAEQNNYHARKALEALQALATLDFRDPVLLRTDPDLAALQKEPAFRALLGKME